MGIALLKHRRTQQQAMTFDRLRDADGIPTLVQNKRRIDMFYWVYYADRLKSDRVYVEAKSRIEAIENAKKRYWFISKHICVIETIPIVDKVGRNYGTARAILEGLYGNVTRPRGFSQEMTDYEIRKDMLRAGYIWRGRWINAGLRRDVRSTERALGRKLTTNEIWG